MIDPGGRAGRRLPAATVLGLVLAGVLAVGLVLTRATPGYAAAKQPSYCSASLAVDRYLGHSDTAVHALLARVLAVAPVDVVSDVKAMRAAPLRSTRYATAKDLWSRYNNNHCCACIGGTSVPHVVVTPIH